MCNLKITLTRTVQETFKLTREMTEGDRKAKLAALITHLEREC